MNLMPMGLNGTMKFVLWAQIFRNIHPAFDIYLKEPKMNSWVE